ncbi:hypothetical protein PO909_020715 [Leuciscus waleckii]
MSSGDGDSAALPPSGKVPLPKPDLELTAMPKTDLVIHPSSRPFSQARLTEPQAASSLHAMNLLLVHQAKALKQLHEGRTDPELFQEVRTAMDITLWATKVTACTLDQKMSTLVVQECHLWLNFGNSSPLHRNRRRRLSTSCHDGQLLLPRCRLLHSLPLPLSLSSSYPRPPQADRPAHPGRQTERQTQGQTTLRRVTQRQRRELFRRWCPHHSLPWTRAGRRILYSVYFFFQRWPHSQQYRKTSIKEQFPLSLGPKRARLAVYDAMPCHPRLPFLSPAGSSVYSEAAVKRSPTPSAPPNTMYLPLPVNTLAQCHSILAA